MQIHAQNLKSDPFAWTRRDGQTALDKMEEGAALEVIQTEASHYVYNLQKFPLIKDLTCNRLSDSSPSPATRRSS